MTDALSLGDADDAHRALQRPLRVDLDYDRAEAAALIAEHADVLASAGGCAEHERVLASVTHLVTACAGLAMLGGDLDSRFGLELVDRFTTRNGYLLLPAPMERVRLLEVLSHVPKRPVPPSASQLGYVRSWAGRNIVEIASGGTLAERTESVDRPRPLQCFLASPLTSVPCDEEPTILDLCDAAASVLAEYGVLSVQPALYTSPRWTPIDRDDPVYRSIDERLIADSDVVLVLAARASLGLGVVASTAQRYRKPLVLATVAPVVTPMITGLDPVPTILRLEIVEKELRRYLDDALPALEESAERARRKMSEIETELVRLRALVDDMPPHDMPPDAVDPRSGQVLNRARFRELVNRPELFAGATFLEVRELYALFGE